MSDLLALLRKIDVWWVVSLEIPTDPVYDGKEIAEDGIVPGSILAIQMLVEVASGNTELLEHYRKSKTRAAK